MDKGLTVLVTKMGADNSAKNIPNATESICPICLPKPKILNFNEKSFIGIHSVPKMLQFSILVIFNLLLK